MPKQKRYRNLRKLIDGSSLDTQPNLTSNGPVQPGLMRNNSVPIPPHPPQVVSSPAVNNEASQLPNETSSEHSQQNSQSSSRKKDSHYWFVDVIGMNTYIYIYNFCFPFVYIYFSLVLT